MTLLDHARELDAANRLREAAEVYEQALRASDDGLSVFLDLAVLYFTLVDPGEAAAQGVDRQHMDRAWERATELLNQAAERFGTSSEIEFWREYFDYIVLGGDSFVDSCRSFANREDSLVPFYYLWAESEWAEYRDEVQELYESVASGRTARERYLRSVIESGRQQALRSRADEVDSK